VRVSNIPKVVKMCSITNTAHPPLTRRADASRSDVERVCVGRVVMFTCCRQA